MRRHRRLALAGLSAAATATAVVAALLAAPFAQADVPSPYFATTGNGSDPHMTGCTDPSTGTAGYCLYTTVDMGQSNAYPDGCETPGDALDCANYYPMEKTKLYFSTNGYSGWTDKGQVFHENTLETAGWVPTNAYHLWAPSAIKDGLNYYLFVPDVRSISDDHDDEENIHNSSQIAVARATSPFGPYTYQGRVDDAGEYMSDPDVIIDGSARVLIWANGDNDTCGGFSAAQLDSDWRTTVDHSIVPIDIEGVEVLGSCEPKDGNPSPGRPYMEGASIYKSGNTWTMYFAVKPMSTPAECATGVGGEGTSNEAIAWATAPSYTGTWTYKGIVMCGSTTEWTNQATVQTLPNGRKIIVYHDAGSGSDTKQRNLHAECLFTNGTITAIVYKQALNAANGFNDCMAGTNASYWALHMKDPQQPSKPPIIRAPSNGGAVTANRYAVGPWERYKQELVGTCCNYAFKALSNGKYLCTPDAATPVTASCASKNDVGASWSFQSATGGSNLRNTNNNKFLSVAGNGNLYASGNAASDGAVVNQLFAGGKQS